MINALLYSIALLSLFTLLQISFFLYTHSSSRHAKIYFTPSDLQETRSINPKIPQSVCKLHEPKYTKSELRHIFAPSSYSSCRTTTKDQIEIENFHIYANCELNEPMYFVDPGEPQKFGGGEKDPVEWTKSYKFEANSEFAFVKCGNKSVYPFVFNRFRQEVADRANGIRDRLQKSPKKNFNVFLLVFDSLSRFVSYNFLPKFTEYLKKTLKKEESEYSVYEFTKVGLPEEYTLPNMAPLLYGDSWERLKNQFFDPRIPHKGTSQRHIDIQQEKSIWTYYSSLGYTTLFLYDTSWDFVSRFVGRDILSDHMFQNFWRHAWDIYGWHDFSNSQRCMGKQNSHNISFTYILEYFSNYKSNNKFAYAHLSPSHENSGNVQTLDSELKVFVESLLGLMKERNEDLVFYIVSDHGWKYPGMILDLRYPAEVLSPMSYVLISKAVEEKIGSREVMEHNSEQLISRYDMHLGMKCIAHYPYGGIDEEEVLIMKRGYVQRDVYNLFSEKIRYDRTCADIGVEKNRCVCSWFEEFDVENWREESPQERFSQLLTDFFTLRASQDSCAQLHSLNLTKGKKFRIQPENKGLITFYELHYLLNSHTPMIGHFTFALENRLKKPPILKENKYKPILRYNSFDNTILIQLTDVKMRVGCGDESCLCKIVN